jgi:putative acetyltransferase
VPAPTSTAIATRVREERPGEEAAIRRVNVAAFATTAEADLVDRLRAGGRLEISLVAVVGTAIVGHIAFSAVTVEPETPGLRGTGLGPMAVIPDRQGQGIGSRLVRAGLDLCRKRGVDFVVVLGHARYYPRFGFVPADRLGLRCIWEVPEGIFMAMELRGGALRRASGTARYQPEFNDV